MSWRTIVVSNRAKLELKLSYMVVRTEESTKKIHLSELYMVIIESTQVSVTVSLLSELVAKKVKVIFCDEKRNPCSELLPCYGSHDTSAKIREQVAWSEETKGLVWTEIVAEKIRKQAEILGILEKPEQTMLIEYVYQMGYRDTSNREGHAAKVYFNALFGKDFTRTADNPVNAALNYGYGLLLSAFNREIVAAGYVTQLGLFHDNQFNPYNFASDLMEPFRPLVDLTVVEMLPDEFEKEEKHHLVAMLNNTVIIDKRKQFLSNAIKIYCKSIFDALNENDVSHIRFYRNEL